MSVPTSPPVARARHPRWSDPRLLLGVLLVLGSVLAGARVVAAADRADRVWAATRDLAAGTQLAAADVRPARVRLYASGDRYLDAAALPPVGYVLIRGLSVGELVPRAGLVAHASATRLVTVALRRLHLPPGLARGERVDVYLTERAAGRLAPPDPRLVFPAALVDSVRQGGSRLGSTTADVAVVLRVPPEAVPAILAAVNRGEVDLVRVPPDAP